jgi:multidrug resistance protein, MATE family
VRYAKFRKHKEKGRMGVLRCLNDAQVPLLFAALGFWFVGFTFAGFTNAFVLGVTAGYGAPGVSFDLSLGLASIFLASG